MLVVYARIVVEVARPVQRDIVDVRPDSVRGAWRAGQVGRLVKAAAALFEKADLGV